MSKIFKYKSGSSIICLDVPEDATAGPVYDTNGLCIGHIEHTPSVEDLPRLAIGFVPGKDPINDNNIWFNNFNLINREEFCKMLGILAHHSGYKIPAIKLLRQATGWGLKEAKDFVEWCHAQEFGDDD